MTKSLEEARIKLEECVVYGGIWKMDNLEERKPRITVLFYKVRLLTRRTIEYKTDYTSANIRLLICHGPAPITSGVRNVSAAYSGEATQEPLAITPNRSGQFSIY